MNMITLVFPLHLTQVTQLPQLTQSLLSPLVYPHTNIPNPCKCHTSNIQIFTSKNLPASKPRLNYTCDRRTPTTVRKPVTAAGDGAVCRMGIFSDQWSISLHSNTVQKCMVDGEWRCHLQRTRRRKVNRPGITLLDHSPGGIDPQSTARNAPG